MPKQDFFSKQENKGTFSGGTIRQQPKKESGGHVTLWIMIILLIALGIAGYFYKDKLFDQEINTTIIDTQYAIGTEIQEEGILSADGDLLNYTHSLTNKQGDIFLLKSKSISLNNLSDLSGTFKIEGTIESSYGGYPLVEVRRIESNTANDENNQEILIDEGTPGIYIANAGLGFPIDFYDNYAFVGDTDNGQISISNLDNNKITTIDYFNCTDAGDTNCKQLTKTFEANANKKIVTLNGDTYYKLPDVKSRYFQNGNWWGYFINDADDEEVEELKDFIVIPNTEIIKDIVTRYGVRVCLGTDKGLNTITSHSVSKKSDGLHITMKGTGENEFNCEALVDFTESNQLRRLNLEIIEKDTEPEIQEEKNEEIKEEKNNEETIIETPTNEETKEVATTTGEPITPSVSQFPINPEKAMTYNSTRGEYSMSFPSSNISYSSDAISDTLGADGIRCTYAVKVIQYKYKEELQNNPSVIVYECNLSEGYQLPGDNYFVKELGDKKFVIEVRNPEWFEFAKSITITSL